MSAKWGVFGKSFNEIGQAIKGRIKDVNNALAVTNDLSTSLKDSPSILARLFPTKESIQSKLIDVDKVYPKIDPDNFDFDKWINELGDIDQKVKAGTISWQKYSNSLDENERWIAKWGQETEGQIRTQEQMIAGNKRLRQSALEHNAALKQQTLGAKAAVVGLNLLERAGNAVVSMGTAILASLAINGIITLITNACQSVDEKIKELNAYDINICSIFT